MDYTLCIYDDVKKKRLLADRTGAVEFNDEKKFVLRISATGDKSETTISDNLLNQLPLFIDMVLIENIVDEFEGAAREGEEVDYEDIESAVSHLLN